MQVPTGLYKALPVAARGEFEQIHVDSAFSPVECFLRSIFELAVFDVTLANDVIDLGMTIVVI